MSRMDVLTPEELKEQISRSVIAGKYNEVIDSDSAYEILSRKIQLPAPGEKKETGGGRSTGRSSGSRSRVDPVVKVLTSATFVRGVFSILNKVLK